MTKTSLQRVAILKPTHNVDCRTLNKLLDSVCCKSCSVKQGSAFFLLPCQSAQTHTDTHSAKNTTIRIRLCCFYLFSFEAFFKAPSLVMLSLNFVTHAFQMTNLIPRLQWYT